MITRRSATGSALQHKEKLHNKWTCLSQMSKNDKDDKVTNDTDRWARKAKGRRCLRKTREEKTGFYTSNAFSKRTEGITLANLHCTLYSTSRQPSLFPSNYPTMVWESCGIKQETLLTFSFPSEHDEALIGKIDNWSNQLSQVPTSREKWKMGFPQMTPFSK